MTVLAARRSLLLALAMFTADGVHADAVTDWNARVPELVGSAALGGLSMAIVQTAVFDAVNAITRRYPSATAAPQANTSPSIEAAVAAANRASLAQLVPARQGAIDAAYQAALAALPEGAQRHEGVAVGERAAAAVLARRAGERCADPDGYRPHAVPGIYVPTVTPAAANPIPCKPWLLQRPDELRPGPPPDLRSALWARDYNEVKTLGGRASTQRTPEQADIARFWVGVTPVYYPLIRSVALPPGREITANARFLALAMQALEDAATAFFEAKYHYAFWRPVTAIRNGDIDGNDATERDPRWSPLIDTPMHPEYPCAHCVGAAVVGSLVKAEQGSATLTLTLPSIAVPGAVRSWADTDQMVAEVAMARIWGGVHYRNSTEAAVQMGRRMAELALQRFGNAAP